MTRLTIAARDKLPDALAAVQDWLQPIEHPDYIVHLLHQSGLCKRYPAEALRLLGVVIADQPWPPRELGMCLDEIANVAPELTQDAQFQRLREYFRSRAM